MSLLHTSFIEKQAEDFRQQYGYGTDKPINLQSLLLELNVPTFFKPMKSVSGMAYKSDKNEKFILINSAQTVGRQNFTICHELYHLFVQKDFEYKVCVTQKFDKKDKHEYYADLFASFFLLPSKGIRDLVPDDEFEKDSISLDTVVKIEQAFQCSRLALLHRLKQLHLISDSKKIEYSTHVKSSAYNRAYPIRLYEKTDSIDVWGDYGKIALDLFQNRKISEGDYTSLMIDVGIDVLASQPEELIDF